MRVRFHCGLIASVCMAAIVIPPSGLAQDVGKASAPPVPAQADLDALVKAWSDARFWILTRGRRTGWQRYQVRWGDYAGEKSLVVDFERATYLFTSDRFTAWLRPDATLSPRALRWGKSWNTLEIDKGQIDPRGFAQKDPGNLSIFPLLLTSFIPLTENAELAFNVLSAHARKPQPGKMKTLSMEAPPSAAQSGPVWKIQLATPVQRFEDPETWETLLWLKPDRTLLRAQTKISYTLSFSGEKRQVIEELIPVEPTEWGDESLNANEVWTHAQLCLLGDMNLVLRANDVDENNANDYWTGDVSGLSRLIPPKKKEPISLIPKEVALADAAPLPAGPEKGGASMADPAGPKPVPWHGYFFKVLSHGREEGKAVVLNAGTNHHPHMFGICAFPAEYGKTGRRTFIITESLQSFWKDLKGLPAEEAPADLNKEGWQWDGPRR